MANIYEKLAKIRVDLQNTKLTKSGKNKFAGFEYFELKDFLPAINQMFMQDKLFSTFSIDGNEAHLRIINSEKPDETILFTSPVKELQLKGCNDIQALGGTHTYLRRYLYMNALEIVENDLFDGADREFNKNAEKTIKEDNKIISKIQLESLHKSIENNNISDGDITKVLANYSYTSTSEIQIKDYMKIVEGFSKLVKKD